MHTLKTIFISIIVSIAVYHAWPPTLKYIKKSYESVSDKLLKNFRNNI